MTLSTARIRELREVCLRMRGRLSDWCHTYGAALCPTLGSADTFGDGMRAAKQQIGDIIASAPAHQQPAPTAPTDQFDETWFAKARSTSHWICLEVRYDGKTYRAEADWLKRWQP